MPLAVWEHFGHADLLEVLNALLQILLQHLPLLLILVSPGWGGAVLLGGEAGQCLQVQGGRTLGAFEGRRAGGRRGGDGLWV